MNYVFLPNYLTLQEVLDFIEMKCESETWMHNSVLADVKSFRAGEQNNSQ